MLTVTLAGKTHEVEMTWAVADRVYNRVGDPWKILEAPEQLGLVLPVRIVASAFNLPEDKVGAAALESDHTEILRASAEVLKACLPAKIKITEVDEAKKT